MSLTRPVGEAGLSGPVPTDQHGDPLDPGNVYNHDHLYWLDRMVRSDHQLVERMALVLHDWFATTNGAVGSQRFMLEQTNLFRRHALGSFHELVLGTTQDPAMILFLNQNQNRRGAINENYAREVMELFTLGADRGAYTEADVRELARALSGWRTDYAAGTGHTNFRFDATRHDGGSKTVFGKTGAWNWRDACRLVVEHPLHSSFLVPKLWSYFVPVPPSAAEQASLEQLYVSSGRQLQPLLEAILCSPALYADTRMVKPPVVHVAGMLRALGRPVQGVAWESHCNIAGQRLYYPPDVAGWDDQRWLDTSTLNGRWTCARFALAGNTIPSTAWSTYSRTETPEEAVAAARAVWGDPPLTAETVAVLGRFATSCVPASATASQRAQRQNALRQLIASCPDYLTS